MFLPARQNQPHTFYVEITLRYNQGGPMDPTSRKIGRRDLNFESPDGPCDTDNDLGYVYSDDDLAIRRKYVPERVDLDAQDGFTDGYGLYDQLSYKVDHLG
jgi:hypothetical protein